MRYGWKVKFQGLPFRELKGHVWEISVAEIAKRLQMERERTSGVASLCRTAAP